MYSLAAVGLTALVSLAAPTEGAAGGVPALVREYANAYAGRVSSAAGHVEAAAPIPAWTRKYNLDCSACHWPAPPAQRHGDPVPVGGLSHAG
jgi:predicted CxxxxCH...CXXCH cytochrome family protein